MFNGIPDQFYQFIDSRTALTLPLPLSLPLHVSHPCFSGLDSPPSHPQQQQLIFQSHHPLLHHHHHQLHRHSPTVEDEEEEQEEEREVEDRTNTELLHGLNNLKPTSQQADPWIEEEILALWRVRSSIESGFTDFVWEHVSRKLAEVGFKRSAEICKEKYEEVSKYCNNNSSYSKNYRSFNELEALYEGPNPNISAEKVVMSDEGDAKMKMDSEENSGNETLVNPPVDKECVTRNSRTKKRKRHHKLKLLKSFCEEIVNKIMVQQEELQYKLLQDMERKEEERIAKEEAWRKQEMARMDREIELRAPEQAITCYRETTIIEFLKNLGSCPSQFQGLFLKNEDLPKSPKNPNQVLDSPSLNPLQNPEVPTSSTRALAPQNPTLPTQSNPAEVPSSSTIALALPNNNAKVPTSSSTPADPTPQNPESLATQENPPPQIPNYTSSDREDHGKRWPRNEVYSLINLRCNLYSSGEDKEGSKVPLWDREDHGKRWPRNEVYSLINLRCNLYSSGEDKEGSKVPLWERISKGMLELGYTRSAKRCKEKWENINKYFRKTRDANKKRSPDSKTCPYFHQLSSLYNQGKLALPSEGPENNLNSPENHSESPVTHFRSPENGLDETVAHVDEGNKKNSAQVPALEFEY